MHSSPAAHTSPWAYSSGLRLRPAVAMILDVQRVGPGPALRRATQRHGPKDVESAEASGEVRWSGRTSEGPGWPCWGQGEACSRASHEEVTQALLPLSWPCLISSHIPFLPQVPQTRLRAWLLPPRTSSFVIPAAVGLPAGPRPCPGWDGQNQPPWTRCPAPGRALSYPQPWVRSLREGKGLARNHTA